MEWFNLASFILGAGSGIIGGVILGGYLLLRQLFPKGFSMNW